MEWIAVYKSMNGAKLRNLYKTIKCSKFEAAGILLHLWFWADENSCNDGIILYADREDLERYFYGEGAGSTLDMKVVVDALVSTGWIDIMENGDLKVHDWGDWQEYLIKAKERREADMLRKRESRRQKADELAEKTPKEEPIIKSGPEGGQAVKTKPAYNQYPPEFEKFWGAYPRHADKGMAYKKYVCRKNDGFSDGDLLLAAKNYATSCKKRGTDKEFIKHPKTFLGDSLAFTEYLPNKGEKNPVQETPDTSNPFAAYAREGGDCIV